jgi:hypothetical protein
MVVLQYKGGRGCGCGSPPKPTILLVLQFALVVCKALQNCNLSLVLGLELKKKVSD